MILSACHQVEKSLSSRLKRRFHAALFSGQLEDAGARNPLNTRSANERRCAVRQRVEPLMLISGLEDARRRHEEKARDCATQSPRRRLKSNRAMPNFLLAIH